MLKLSDVNVSGQRVLVREDLNVPIKNGLIQNDKRLQAALPTLKLLLQQGARVRVVSHLGRPQEGQFESAFSLAPVADYLSNHLDHPVRFESDWLAAQHAVMPGELVVCENVRFQVGEKANDDILAQKMASLCDIFVMDAFGCAHRAHASTHGIAKYANIACAGPLLVKEVEALQQALDSPQQPLVAIVGGSKVSSKLTVLQALLNKVDTLIVGGGIANTFIAAKGISIGNSLYEKDLIPVAKDLLAQAKEQGKTIPIPNDVVVAKQFSETAQAVVKGVEQLDADDMILDIGPQSSQAFTDILTQAKTILWNGPVGVFEFAAFSAGTKALAVAISQSDAFSIAGGGDTLAAIDAFNIAKEVSYISTGGGAFLEFIEGKHLPAIAILDEKNHG